MASTSASETGSDKSKHSVAASLRSNVAVAPSPSAHDPDTTTTATGTETDTSASASVTQAPIRPPPTISIMTKEEEEELAHKYDYKPAAPVKKFVFINNRPIAVAIETEEEVQHQKDRKLLQQLERRQSLNARRDSEDRGKTYRIWHPNQQRKSVTVKAGGRENHSDKVFATGHMQKKTFAEWKKEAQAQLPSVTGGTQVDKVDDVLHLASAVQKQSDTRNLERTKRVTVDSLGEAGELAREAFMKRKTKKSVVRFAAEAEGVYHPDEDEDESDDHLTEAQKAALTSGVDIKAKIHNLKELADHLTEKKRIRERLIASSNEDFKRISEFFQRYSEKYNVSILQTIILFCLAAGVTFKDHIVYFAQHIHSSIRDVFSWLVIWEKEINEINGRFGIVVSTYFVWLRRMFALSIFTFLLTFFLIMIPEFVEYKTNPLQGNIKKTPDFHISDLLHGGGSLENTFLYYSGYANYDATFKRSAIHSAAARFAIVLLIMFAVNTYVVVSRISRFYHGTRLESKMLGVAQTTHFKMIMCAWEFSCDNEEASFYLHKSIGRDLAFLAKNLTEGEREIAEIETNKKKKLLGYLVKKLGLVWGDRAMLLISNLFLLLCCVIQGEVIYLLCDLKRDYYVECISERDDNVRRIPIYNEFCPGGDTYLQTLVLSCPAVFASITTLILTRVIVNVGDMENFRKMEWKLLASMVRAGLFNFTSIAVFYGFWLHAKSELSGEGYVAETIFGEEMYKLVVIQGLLDIIFNCGGKYLYHRIRKIKRPFYKKGDFRPEYPAQAMFFLYPVQFVGTLFCPPISVLVSLRLAVDFYWHRYELLKLSSQESYSAHASIVYTPYLLTFLLYFLLSAFLTGIYFTESTPSKINGPFKHYTHSYDEVIIEMVQADGSMSWLQILASRGAIFSWITILLASVYFCRQWAKAYLPIQEQLNELILLERGDRDLLLKAIYEIANVTADNEESETDASSAVITPEPQSSTETEHDDYIQLEKKVDYHIDHLISQVQRSVRAPTQLRTAVNRQSKSNQNAENIAQISVEQRKHRDELKNIIGHIVDARRNMEIKRAKGQRQPTHHHPPAAATTASPSTPSLYSLRRPV